MPTPERRTLAAADAGLTEPRAACVPVVTPDTRNDPALDRVVDALCRQSERANAALMRGDIEQYLSLVRLTDDFTLMSPFGGPPSRGARFTPDRMQAVARFFRNGNSTQELVQNYASAEMVVLVVIEHAQHVEVGGLAAQDWALRVTLVYRREGGQWRLAHRHADPLAPGISLEQAAALARGEPC